jgi:hypothetical protein
VITLEGTFTRATTTVDGGWRISFDLDERQAKEITEITKLRDKAVYICVMTKAEQRAQEQRENSDGEEI